jgi:hypothetical protein
LVDYDVAYVSLKPLVPVIPDSFRHDCEAKGDLARAVEDLKQVVAG